MANYQDLTQELDWRDYDRSSDDETQLPDDLVVETREDTATRSEVEAVEAVNAEMTVSDVVSFLRKHGIPTNYATKFEGTVQWLGNVHV
jgi:hypothetical protein